MTKREMALRLLEQATAKRPVTRWQLMAMLEMNDRDAREVIHTLRLQGVLDGLRACEAECAGVLGVDPQKTSEAVIEVARAIDGGMSFDGIFCASVRLTVGAMSAIRERKLEDSIRVAGYGVHRLYRYGLIDYMAIYEPIREMAVAAANGMLAMIRGEAIPEEQVFASRRLATREDALSTIS